MPPLYDCGVRECMTCDIAFGPNRDAAIEAHEARLAYYATLPLQAATESPQRSAKTCSKAA